MSKRFKHLKFFLVITVLLLTGVACGSNGPSEREQSLEATVAALQDQQSSGSSGNSDSPTAIYDPTPIPDTNPAGPVHAGQTIIMDGIALTVKDDFRIETASYGTRIYVSFFVQNTGTRTRMLSYQRSSIGMMDNLGNNYPAHEHWAEDLYEILQISLDPGKTYEFNSGPTFSVSNTIFQFFTGPIAPQATKIIVTFDGFGPFTGIEVEIDL